MQNNVRQSACPWRLRTALLRRQGLVLCQALPTYHATGRHEASTVVPERGKVRDWGLLPYRGRKGTADADFAQNPEKTFVLLTKNPPKLALLSCTETLLGRKQLRRLFESVPGRMPAMLALRGLARLSKTIGSEANQR